MFCFCAWRVCFAKYSNSLCRWFILPPSRIYSCIDSGHLSVLLQIFYSLCQLVDAKSQDLLCLFSGWRGFVGSLSDPSVAVCVSPSTLITPLAKVLRTCWCHLCAPTPLPSGPSRSPRYHLTPYPEQVCIRRAQPLLFSYFAVFCSAAMRKNVG